MLRPGAHAAQYAHIYQRLTLHPVHLRTGPRPPNQRHACLWPAARARSRTLRTALIPSLHQGHARFQAAARAHLDACLAAVPAGAACSLSVGRRAPPSAGAAAGSPGVPGGGADAIAMVLLSRCERGRPPLVLELDVSASEQVRPFCPAAARWLIPGASPSQVRHRHQSRASAGPGPPSRAARPRAT